ncbi:MAG: tRNA 2-selenouridine(34) synthase MnmH [bacterium]|nr:tRNA 2-selenouridine(34) synthase MnmH [bacterium]
MATGTNPQAPMAHVPMVDVDRVLRAPDAAVIDLRSPAEFAQDALPGALNVPLLGDVERSLVGLLYTQFSPQAAFAEGRAAIADRIEGLVREIADHVDWEPPAGCDLRARLLEMTANGIEPLERELAPEAGSRLPERPVVLHCWRGGLRSKSVIAFLRGLGLERAVGLEGGYKSWRAHVLGTIDTFEAPPAYVLRGLTGVGKTLVLRALERIRPRWTFDLELQAGHRSSLLGMVGLEPATQKIFDSRIAERLRTGFDGLVVFEGESRKVGDAVVPAAVWRAMQTATNIEITAPIARRVAVLREDYLRDSSALPKLREQLGVIEVRMPGVHLVEMFDAGEIDALVELLLDRYYDPLYRHSETGKEYAVKIDSTDPDRAALAIADWIESR